MSNYVSGKSPEFGVGSYEQINEFRKRLELKPFVFSMKNCLKCDIKFESSGSHNWICPKCNSSREGYGNKGLTNGIKGPRNTIYG